MMVLPDARDWSHFVHVALGAACAALIICTGLMVASDPFYIWQKSPPWLVIGKGGNLNLDTRHRLWKPLALAGMPADIVLVGSSRMYRGLDPADMTASVPEAGRIFNFGVSSLSLQEISAISQLLASPVLSARPRQVIIGLDEYMFNSLGEVPRTGAIRPDIATSAGLRTALLQTITSFEALRGLADLWLRRPYEGGVWQRNGFKITSPRPASETMALYEWQQFHDKPFLPGRLRELESVLNTMSSAGIRPIVYLSPISGPMQARLHGAGRWLEYQELRARIGKICNSLGLAYHDLATDHPFQEFDPAAGSSDNWIDHHHFTPRVGRWILWRLGLRPDAR